MHVLLCIPLTESLGELEPIPTSLTSPSCHDLPSTKIDPDAIKQLELLDLLHCYSECFADVPGYSNVTSHSITLKEGFRPKRLPAYRVPERLKPMVDRQIQEMLDNNIIRPSSSPMVCIL